MNVLAASVVNPIPWFVGGGIALFVALALLAYARRADARNWIYERAPALPIRLLCARDDAWVRGLVVQDRPLHVPHFYEPCVYYDYSLEEQRTRTVTTKQGTRTETYWETIEHDQQGIPFTVVDAEHSIRVDPNDAILDQLHWLGYDHDGPLRHSARILRVGHEVSVLGSVSEDGAWLEPYANIPLLVTTRTRDAYLESAERREKGARITGFVLLALGSCGLAFGTLAQTMPPTAFAPLPLEYLVAAAAIGLCVTFFAWVFHAYNTLVAYRTRTLAAWRHIDVDLKQRFDLVPNLVACASAAAAHERGAFEALARLRTELLGASAHDSIRGDAGFRDAVAQCIAVVERYPELHSNANFQKLHDQLVALEDKIAHDRVFFDDCATEFNTTIEAFPRSLLARAFRFEAWPLFRSEAVEREAPNV